MRLRRSGAPLLVLAGTLWASLALTGGTAHAQRGIDSQLFRPSVDSYGIFTLERAEVSHQWDFGFKLYGNYAGNPLRLSLVTDDGTHMNTKSQVVMDRQIAINLGMHLGLTNWLELILDFPVSSQNYTPAYGLYGTASDKTLTRTGFYVNDKFTNVPPPDATALDARIGFKAKIFRKGMFGMAAAAIVTLPFGDDAAFLGDTNFTFRPNLIADLTRGPITVALNIGAIIREETKVYDPLDQAAQLPKPHLLLDVGHELTWGVGLAYRFVHWVGLGAEVFGYIPLVGEQKDYTADVVGGLQFFPTKDLIVAAGAGAGVFASANRHDDYRAFFGITWAPVEGGRGSVGGGGLDSDNDGIPDAQDLCPNEPEDKDGFDDEDGCPDPDNDQDGIPDKLDKCPNEPEDKDGFQDQDGCPDLDNDHDGIPDAQDKCPNDPEDRDGFQDDDGCPDADNDGDGIPDVADKCPNEPETFNGVDDEDGCPDSGGTVVMGHEKIDLPEAIAFETGKAIISAKSAPLLDKIADKIKSNPQVKKIRIEGHADSSESKKKAQQLSQSRAEAVRDFLIRKGVEDGRLQAVGYGDSRPLDKRNTADARAKNRRVEFIIVDQ